MSEAKLYVAQELTSFSEIDWSEDKLTLTLRSDGEFTAEEEISAWSHSFAETALNLVQKIGTAYSLDQKETCSLMDLMKNAFDSQIAKLVDEQF